MNLKTSCRSQFSLLVLESRLWKTKRCHVLYNSERKDLAQTGKYLEEHFIRKQNVIHNRRLFMTRYQQEGEKLQSYLVESIQLSQNCWHDSITAEHILRDRLVYSIREQGLKQSLHQATDLYLKQCIEKCRNAEKSRSTISGEHDRQRAEPRNPRS